MRALVGIAVIAMTGSAWAMPKVPVCVEFGPDGPVVMTAQRLASKMYADIAIQLEWLAWARHRDLCSRNGAIVITLSYQTSPTDHPNAWAYALPFEGQHIVVFWDRVKTKARILQAQLLLAHILVHEIAHILEGTDVHSTAGVMKARWDTDDLRTITTRHPLGFTETDVNLIHRGLEARSLLASILRK